MRLIDADALPIDSIDMSNMIEVTDRGIAVVRLEDIVDAATIDGPAWIPCSERLPEEGETVLVYMNIEGHKHSWEEKRNIEFGRISSNRYDAKGTGWEWLNESAADFWESDWNNCIVAWMPLPKPYEEGADDETDRR